MSLKMSFKILYGGDFCMKKFGGFGRDKVALFLVCMSVLGNKASATNTKKLKTRKSSQLKGW